MSKAWAERLKALRERLSLSQRDMAFLLNSSFGTLQNWEYGIGESTRCLDRLMDFLEQEPDQAVQILSRHPAPVFPDEASWKEIVTGLQKKLGTTNEAMAEVLDVDVRQISYWKAGQRAPQSGCQQLMIWLLNAYADVPPAEWPPILRFVGEARPHMEIISPERIRLLRQGFMMRQRDLGNLLHISRSQISTWESGREAPSWCPNLLLLLLERFPGPAFELIESVPWGDLGITPEKAVAIRKQAGLTQVELSLIMGVTIHTVQYLESGANKTLDCGEMFYHLLETRTSDLLGMIRELENALEERS